MLRTEGLASFWTRLASAMGVYRRLDLVFGPIPRGNEAARIPLLCGQLGADEVDDYLALRADQDRADIEARLAAGELCLVARSEGRVIAATWIALGRARIDYLYCEIELADDAAYCYDTWVSHEHRGLRVADALAEHRGQVLEQLGRTTAAGLNWPENRNTRRRRERRRFLPPAGRLLCFGLGPWRCHVLRVERARGDPPIRVAEGRSPK